MTQFWFVAFLAVKWLGLAALVAWFMVRCLKRTQDERLISKWIITAALIPVIVTVIFTGLPLFAVPVGVIIGLMWAPNLGRLLASPLTDAFDGGDVELEPQPFYSIAEARRKRGDYATAVAEIRKQLARFPTDVPGHLMLAEIQAIEMKDLAAAQDTVERLLVQDGHAPKNLAVALNCLADWQLRIGRDPEAARESLERIRQLFPDSELAQLAAQRLAHLPDKKMLAAQEHRGVIALPQNGEKAGLREDFAGLKPPGEDLAETAAQYVRHLEEYPLDYEAREKLALLYADQFQRFDLAAHELEQLISYPNQPAKQVVHWLNLLADLHIRCGGDIVAARQALERIIEFFPAAAAAEIARHRIRYLKIELKGQQKSQAVPLGSYEQNIGLKRGWPT
jgi:tetratricopeptide (TPR) repeat protein